MTDKELLIAIKATLAGLAAVNDTLLEQHKQAEAPRLPEPAAPVPQK